MPALTVRRAQPSVCWPMTAQAAAALETEIQSVEAELAALRTRSSRGDGGAGLVAAAIQRLGDLQAVLGLARITDAPDTALIGRRVSIETDDGEKARFWLVLPADGDPDRGWIGADSPLGIALLERRVGDRTTVLAPGGTWEARVVDVD